ncbi:unnamed protein product, partial [Sphacelaria rigidula]
MDDSSSRKKGCWLTDHAQIPVPPSKKDFVMVGNLQKRRGGFARIASPSWKKRCFVLLKTGNLAYFEAGVFDSINFCHPPRGILTLDEDVVITKSPRSDADGAGDVALIIQGNGQRWKLGSEVPGEISRWEEALRSMIQQKGIPSNGTAGRPAQSLYTNGTAPAQLPYANGTANGPPNGTAAVKTVAATVTDAAAPRDTSRAQTLAVVDAVCYFLHTNEQTSAEAFFAAIIFANLVIAASVLRRIPLAGQEGVTGVPLIHEDEVAPLRSALKKRFPSRKIPTSPSVKGEMGDSACGLPSASSTMPRNDGLPESAPPHTWNNGDSSVFRLRGKGYMQDKMKVTPGETLYEVVGMDVFATEARIGNIASEVVMDSLTKDLPQIPVPGVPPMLVLNVQLPSASPALMSAAEDGPGYQCVYYYRIKDSTVRALGNLDTATEGLRLWVEYCQRVGTDEVFQGRFKARCADISTGARCVCVIANYENLGIPSFVTKYNGKPVLINRSGNWIRGDNYFENDINVHRFSFIAKKGLHSLK